MFRAQTLWDGTMSATVVNAWQVGHTPSFLVIGSFHVNHEGGTLQLIRERASPIFRVVHTVPTPLTPHIAPTPAHSTHSIRSTRQIQSMSRSLHLTSAAATRRTITRPQGLPRVRGPPRRVAAAPWARLSTAAEAAGEAGVTEEVAALRRSGARAPRWAVR